MLFRSGPGAAAVNLLVEERDARVSGGTLALADSQVIEGRSFRRWTGRVPAGGTITLTVAGGATTTWRVLAGLVGVVALTLALAAWRLLRQETRTVPRPASGALLDALAALDARYLGREAETPGHEWRAYEAERARLKTELEAALAGPGASR